MHCRDAMHVFQLLLVAAVEAVGLSAAAQHPGQIFLPTTLKCPLPHIHAPHVCPPLPPPSHTRTCRDCCSAAPNSCASVGSCWWSMMMPSYLSSWAASRPAITHLGGGGVEGGVEGGQAGVHVCVWGGMACQTHPPGGGLSVVVHHVVEGVRAAG